VKRLPDERLYSDTAACLAWLSSLEQSPSKAADQPLLCHLYWAGELTRKPAFAIRSFLATQDPDATQLWLWIDDIEAYDRREANRFLAPLLPHIQVLRYDAEKLGQGTAIDRAPGLYREPDPTRRSDLHRFLALYRHGGMYVDVDAMFLRDLRALPAEMPEFCSRWSAHMPYANSAFLRLEREGASASALLERCAQEESSLPWLVMRFEATEEIDLFVLPCIAFDPLWPHHDGHDRYADAPFQSFADFFRPFSWRFRRSSRIRSYRDFFPGAFTYHWHNAWTTPEPAGSYFGLFADEFDDVLEARLGLPRLAPS
jgi:hypothetical protein